jgi:radical SAM superfamily enzyme with C-terminal helix-hairpin-helix motif
MIILISTVNMQIAILDDYIDEPACLGVPPYISPHVRYLAGALTTAGEDYIYLTIDEYRTDTKKRQAVARCDLLIIIAGAVVPGKYLGGRPISAREAVEATEQFQGEVVLGGPAARFGLFDGRSGTSFEHKCTGDIDACLFDNINGKGYSDRMRTLEEQNRWSVKGTKVVRQHPNYRERLIAEIESYRGCVRYHSGGCSFCIEPGYGRPEFREQYDIIAEVETLREEGIENFRLGGQSCIYSYKSKELGSEQNPQPNPAEVKKLLSGFRSAIGPDSLFHIDNANPAVLADYPEESKSITKYLVEYCTSGNVLAFGLEAADPDVKEKNNLNATAEETLTAVRLVNKLGRDRGPNGLPKLLPGINFISGLKGESRETFKLNLDFLESIMAEDLLLRRINIRQVAETRGSFKPTKFRREFMRFKKTVREQIDRPMLEKTVPSGTILRGIWTETHDGNNTFGRQLGTYPILVGISYNLPLEQKFDIYITSHGFRSVTGVEYPFPINTATLTQLKALPGLGAKRAARLVRARPFENQNDLISALDNIDVASRIIDIITLKK